MDISANLRRLRESAGLSQTQAAEQLHITRQAYNHYETGKRLPTLDTLNAMAELFGTNLVTILGREGFHDALSDMEQELITAYRQLTFRQQQIILGRTLEYLELNEQKKRQRTP